MDVLVELSRIIAPDLAAEIETQAAYLSPALRSVRFRPSGSAVECELAFGSNADEARAKVLRFVEIMASRHRRIERKVIAERATGRVKANSITGGVQAELRRRGWLFDLGKGQAGLGGPALALLQKLDADCCEL